MLAVCEMSTVRRYTHYLYGGKPGVAEQLRSVLGSRFAGIRVVGTYCPPFRPLNHGEECDLIRRVTELQPDLFWVGLSTPKQERFMAEFIPKLDAKLMLGVGAAFDIHTGQIKDSPPWVKRAGLQWLHRLCQEPGRLWKRYLINNPEFALNIGLQLAGLKTYPIPQPADRDGLSSQAA